MTADARPAGRTYTIRQLYKEFGCTPRALRFYEDKGLLAPARDGMNRVYSERDRVRLRLVLQGRRVGLSLAQMREILNLYDLKDGGVAQAARAIDAFRARIRELEQRKLEIDETIDNLSRGVEMLEQQLAGAA